MQSGKQPERISRQQMGSAAEAQRVRARGRRLGAVAAALALLGWGFTLCIIALVHRRARNPARQGPQSSLHVLPVACTPTAFAKQSCRFSRVCLQHGGGTDRKALQATLWGSAQPEHVAWLQRHLQHAVSGHFSLTDCRAGDEGTMPPAAFDGRATVLWRESPSNQFSFGHALINEAFPLFNVLQDQLGSAGGGIPATAGLQLLVMRPLHKVLFSVLNGTITSSIQQLGSKLDEAAGALCLSQLVLGDGGYAGAAWASLASSPPGPVRSAYTSHPSFYTSSNWWQFRQHALKVSQVEELTAADTAARPPLIMLNDKRHGPAAAADRRMLLNVDTLVANLSFLYPAAEVRAVRFRDLSFADQLRWLVRARVFVSTQASSSFGLVFLPREATAVIVGAPQAENNTVWRSFHELDAWLPLAYAQILRYEVAAEDGEAYEVRVQKGWWQPADERERRNWWLYNADVRVDVRRLQRMLDPILLPAAGSAVMQGWHG